MFKISLVIMLLFLTSSVFSQTIDEVKTDYENFEYSKVISQSEILLNTMIEDTYKIELNLLKGASQFSLGLEKDARLSFIDLLKIDSSFVISTSRFSPKIVDLFDEVKSNYLSIITNPTEEKSNNIESTEAKTEYKFVNNSKLITEAALKNLLLPGWGQISSGNSTKGYLLGASSTLFLGSMIYFIVETDSKHKDYLTETSPHIIEGKYQKYNDSYKIRNLLIFSYAAVWIYSQLDLFLFTDFDLPNIDVTTYHNYNKDFSFNLSIPLN